MVVVITGVIDELVERSCYAVMEPKTGDTWQYEIRYPPIPTIRVPVFRRNSWLFRQPTPEEFNTRPIFEERIFKLDRYRTYKQTLERAFIVGGVLKVRITERYECRYVEE